MTTSEKLQVTQEKLPASQVALQIQVPAEMSRQAYEKVIQEFTRTLNIPGFRKGKVPRQVLIQRFGATRIKAAAVEELVQNSVEQAIKQEEVEAIGNYQLQSSFEDLVNQYEPGAALTFSAMVDVQPEVNLKQHTGFQVQAEEVTYDPSRVDEVLEGYRSQMATLIPVEGRPAQLGDVTVVDYSGHLLNEDGTEGEEVPGGSVEDYQLELDAERFIPGFIEGIVGMNPGETRQIPVTFPADYPQETLAGRSGQFTITLKEVKEKDPPELNDDFAQEISDFDTLEELKNSLEERYRTEAEQKTKSNKEAALIKALVEQLEVELPETLVQREVDFMITQTAMRLQNQGIDIKKLFTRETVEELRQRSRSEAIERLQRTLALGEVARKESLDVEDSVVNTRVNEILAENKEQDFDLDRLKEVVAEELLTEKIMTWLEEHSTLELVPEGSLKPEEPEPAAELPSEDIPGEAAPAAEATVSVEATPIAEPETPEAAAVSEPEAEAEAVDAVSEEDTGVAEEEAPAETVEDASAEDASEPKKSTRKKKAASE